MARHRSLSRLPRRITGASAVEFALVFPLLFAIVYGTLTYGYVYFLQQRINFIAQEALRAAISVAPLPSNAAYLAAINAAVADAVANNFILGGSPVPAALTYVVQPVNAATNTLSILVTYSLTAPALFPTVSLPGFGAIPPLPAALQATAAGRLS
ncbi:TadE/TadG family type IV pilus assembly protein [uncultured Nevskia sp.]|uniref:TadE/TadG family type IV pilus assembly protein n=1 Tax=uncultured Nevskia sp. TaxID=228950 RepID=UPI0025FB5D9A|nr:TadE family protein [uncultured Nevskia sp.]